jgi:hypothetical protein
MLVTIIEVVHGGPSKVYECPEVLVGGIKISFLMKIQWKQYHYFYTKIVSNDARKSSMHKEQG